MATSTWSVKEIRPMKDKNLNNKIRQYYSLAAVKRKVVEMLQR